MNIKQQVLHCIITSMKENNLEYIRLKELEDILKSMTKDDKNEKSMV